MGSIGSEESYANSERKVLALVTAIGEKREFIWEMLEKPRRRLGEAKTKERVTRGYDE